ncbi:hypothetical protein AOLI_G00001200 [Acnodon oligacanthus]
MTVIRLNNIVLRVLRRAYTESGMIDGRAEQHIGLTKPSQMAAFLNFEEMLAASVIGRVHKLVMRLKKLIGSCTCQSLCSGFIG